MRETQGEPPAGAATPVPETTIAAPGTTITAPYRVTTVMKLCRRMLEAYLEDPLRNRTAVRALAQRGSSDIIAVALDVLLAAPATPAATSLAQLFLAQRAIVEYLADSIDCPRERMEAIIAMIHRVDSGFDLRMAREISVLNPSLTADRRRMVRLLALLRMWPSRSRALPVLFRLMRQGDAAIRSRIVMMLGLARQDLDAMAPYFRDPDPRVRANAVESLWGQSSRAVKNLFACASLDAHPRVAANALLGLYWAGDADAVGQLMSLASRREACWRASAAWAMGRSGDEAFVPLLRAMVAAEEPAVRRCALKALVAIHGCRGTGQSPLPAGGRR